MCFIFLHPLLDFDSDIGSNRLKSIHLKITNFALCKFAYGFPGFLNLKAKCHLYAGSQNGDDTCSGDSGGPLVCLRESECSIDLQGIISFGKACSKLHVPGVYANVLTYRDWIVEVIRERGELDTACIHHHEMNKEDHGHSENHDEKNSNPKNQTLHQKRIADNFPKKSKFLLIITHLNLFKFGSRCKKYWESQLLDYIQSNKKVLNNVHEKYHLMLKKYGLEADDASHSDHSVWNHLEEFAHDDHSHVTRKAYNQGRETGRD